MSGHGDLVGGHAAGWLTGTGGAGDEGPVGWPGDPADGTGLGWPVDLIGTSAAALPGSAPGHPPGWRRILGGWAA